MAQTQHSSKTKSSKAASFLKSVMNKSIFNTKHAEISTKWYVLLHFS